MSTSFPSEIIEAFISATWSLALSADERISLMKTLPLVHSAWRDAYVRVSSRNVHIPCATYCDYLLRTIQTDLGAFDGRGTNFLETVCRSITFTVDHPAAPTQSHSVIRSGANVISDLLYAIQSPRFPNLRRIVIRYHNMSFDDLFENEGFADFPPQVEALELTHSFSPQIPPFLLSALRGKHHAQLGLPWRMPGVKRLFLEGVGSDYIADMVAVCPNLARLELSLAPDTEIFIHLPESIRTLILHAPEDASQKKPHDAFSLSISRRNMAYSSRWLSLRPSASVRRHI